jgi:hypothetical protein
LSEFDPENRIVGGYSEKLGIGSVSAHASEELPDFPFPSLQIGPEDAWFLIIS